MLCVCLKEGGVGEGCSGDYQRYRAGDESQHSVLTAAHVCVP